MKIPSEFPKNLPRTFSKAHRKCGNLWVRRTKTGKTAMTGYFWYHDYSKKRRVVKVIKIIVNPLKTKETAPDYCIYDYSGEYDEKKRYDILTSHWNRVTGRQEEVAEVRGDSQDAGWQHSGQH
ncbi:MAG: hypothetical protein WC469_06020 [Candidatus Omnitrophota bacterium]